MSSAAETKPSYVWALYETHPGIHGKLVGIFSSVNLAKDCALIQPLLEGDWTPREVNGSYIWIAPALDPEFYPDKSKSIALLRYEATILSSPKP